MNQYVNRIAKSVFSLFLVLFLASQSDVFAADGQQIFKTMCSSCHKPDADFTGPMLKGARTREPNPEWVYKWVKNVESMLASDPYAKTLLAKFGPTHMTAFPDMKDEEIKAVLDWADAYTPAPTNKTPGGETQPEGNSMLYGLLTLIMAVVVLILLQVNSNLKKLSDEKVGVKSPAPVPFYRNKAYIMFAVIIMFFIGGYFLINGAIGLGRQKGYMPKQPIFFSHKVHPGINQISCLYCHGAAQDSKHANIPPVNVCMNCHMAVKDYTGTEKLVREDGTEVNGTAEIQKLYDYSGWNPTTKTYDKPGKPIEWIRIHNLPDHVYFNHSQHVKVGKQQCQTCHGPIQEMMEVKQFAELSMGWCVNCHRNTNVQFNDSTGHGNNFYSIYEKFHQDIKDKKYDSVTVEKIGGAECQKCHY